MKYLVWTFALLFLCASLSAQKKKADQLPQHQLVPFYTNAVTGSTRGERQLYPKEPRYGLNAGFDYNVKLVKWFSLGTGLGFILHRSYSSYVYDTLNCNWDCPNSYEGTSTKGILDIPLKIIFTFVKRKKVEFQLETGLSIQPIIHEKRELVSYYDTGPRHYEYSSNGFKGYNTRYGFVVGPVLKIGKGNGLMVEPEFRLIHPERKNSLHPPWKTEKIYSAGLKLGWFFNLN